MIAINARTGKGYESKVADDVVKNIEQKAAYYIEGENHVTILMPAVSKMEDGSKYRFYEVNGKWYESLVTSPYEKLAKLKISGFNLSLDFEEDDEDD